MAITSIHDLPRNDNKKAIELARHLLKSKKLTPDAVQMLLMHQDNPSMLVAELELLRAESKKK
jgi:3-oxoacyl-[acyl-carrier-protein] synthase III